MNGSMNIYNVDPQKKEYPLSKALFWATAWGYGNCENGDATRFPSSLQPIKARIKAYEANEGSAFLPLMTFVEAARNAQDRIWVLDGYLFSPVDGMNRSCRIDAIMRWFPAGLAASSVRLLTASINDDVDRETERQFHELARRINERDKYRKNRLTIEVNFALVKHFPYVHDRFAIIDDELWHFGATVGGLHPDVSATSRGWSAKEYGADQFFDMAWEGDRDLWRDR